MVVATNAPWITLLAVFPRRQKAEAALEGEKRIKIFSSQIRACNILLGICISLLVQFSFLALACPCASNKWCCSAPGVPSKKQNRVPSRAVSAKCEGLCFDNYSHTCIRACIEPLMSFDAEGYSFMCCHPDAGWLRSASPTMMNIRKVELGGSNPREIVRWLRLNLGANALKAGVPPVFVCLLRLLHAMKRQPSMIIKMVTRIFATFDCQILAFTAANIILNSWVISACKTSKSTSSFRDAKGCIEHFKNHQLYITREIVHV